MNFSESLSIIERFFLDVIGSLLPGLFLSCAILCIFQLEEAIEFSKKASGLNLFLALGIAYGLGHFLTWFGERFTEPAYRHAHNLFSSIPILGRNRRHECADKFQEELLQTGTYQEFLSLLRSKEIISNSFNPKRANELRNIALGIKGVDKALAHRFMFLALFNLTTASAIVLSLAIWIAPWISAKAVGILAYFFPGTEDSFSWLRDVNIYPFSAFTAFFAIFVAAGLMERYYRFYGISFRTPISDALTKMAESGRGNLKDSRENSLQNLREVRSHAHVVYLAGGFFGDWQQKVKSEIGNDAIFLDPSGHGITEAKNYSSWDVSAIRSSDIVFGFFSKDNPAGFALSFELGYSVALNKTVILVDEKSKSLGDESRYLDMLNECVTYRSDKLDHGIALLASVLKLLRTDSNKKQ